LSAHTYEHSVTWKFVLASGAPNSNPAHKLAVHGFRRCKLFTFNTFCLAITRFLYVLFRAKRVDSYAFLLKSRTVRVIALSTWLVFSASETKLCKCCDQTFRCSEKWIK